MNRTTRIAALTVALLAAGAAAPAMASDLVPATSSGRPFLCAGSRVISILVCLDDDLFEPIPQLPGVVPDPRPLPVP